MQSTKSPLSNERVPSQPSHQSSLPCGTGATLASALNRDAHLQNRSRTPPPTLSSNTTSAAFPASRSSATKHKAPLAGLGGSGLRAHKRLGSSKALHKLAKSKAAGPSESSENLRKLGASTTRTDPAASHGNSHVRRNGSASNLHARRIPSEREIAQRRVKSAQEPPSAPEKRRSLIKEAVAEKTAKPSTSVHFEIGSGDDGWEEASSSNITSPAVSRAASRPGSRAGTSANRSLENSAPQSPANTRPRSADDKDKAAGRQPQYVDAKFITDRLLQRTLSYNTGTTKMSMTTAMPALYQSPASMDGVQSSASTQARSAGRGNSGDVVSRFIHGSVSGTPDSPAFLPPQHHPGSSENSSSFDAGPQRAKSMHNLSHRPHVDTGSALNPAPNRQPTTPTGYIPPPQSRTQQKLWLQRASSHIEPQGAGHHGGGMGCMLMGLSGPLPPAAAAAAANGYDGSRPGSSSGSYDKMLDPRIRQQCEKIGLQLLVIRRHQDPVSASLKRVGYQAGSGTRDRGRNSQHESRSTWGNLAAQDRIRELEREKERDRMGGGAHGSLSSSLANANANMHGPGIGKKRGRHVNGQGLGHASRGSIDSQTTIAPEDRTGDGSEGDGTAPTRPSSSSNHPTMMGNSAEDRLSAALRSLWDKPLGGALAVE